MEEEDEKGRRRGREEEGENMFSGAYHNPNTTGHRLEDLSV